MRDKSYSTKLDRLSKASVRVNYDPFIDIDWDAEEMQPNNNEQLWVLPEVDPLGASQWYKSLPPDHQIEIGKYRVALICKVGLQFEQVLIGGVMQWLLSGRHKEFRYVMHESREEINHIQMFQEFVNRVSPDVAGAPTWFKILARFAPLVGWLFPVAFVAGILGGEEPIDHIQRAVLKNEPMHPLSNRVMEIHVAEEARHISFAHSYLEQKVPRMGGISKAILSIVLPVMLRLLADAIIIPSKQAQADMGIPPEVAKNIWWKESVASLNELHADVRGLADKTGLRNKSTRVIWKKLGIDG